MVTLNILKLNGTSYNMNIIKYRKASNKETKGISTFRNWDKKGRSRKNSRRREVGYYRKQNRRKFKTAGLVNLKLKKGPRRREIREDIRFGIRGALEVSLVGGDKVTLLFN